MEKNNFPKIPLALISSILILAFSFLVLNTNLFSNTSQKNFFSQSISTVIVPHHDLVALQRQLTLSNVAARVNPKTIIVISPNHFNTGSYSILSTKRVWRLQNAFFEPDAQKIDQLNIETNDLAFDREHGITNLLDPLKNAFPDAKIIPIILKSDVAAAQLDVLVKDLHQTCPNNCLMINSVDFSHYQPASVAAIHDLYSIDALSNLDDIKIWQSEVDSAASLYLGIKWAKAHDTNWFNLEENTNSGLLESAPDAESTSYVFGWFEIGRAQPLNSTTFVAGNNLSNLTDKRLTMGTDEVIDLNNSHEMGVLCYNKPEFCALNRLFWGPNFYRDILNGLVITGEITEDKYKLVLTPVNMETKIALRGEAKLEVINKIRAKLKLLDVKIGDGYDTIIVNR